MPLQQFRTALTERMADQRDRPFLCDGDPLGSRIFLVGFNPATALDQSFWHFWSDESGLDRARLMESYQALRKLRGVRPRLNAISAALPKGVCLETNICSTPTRTDDALAKHQRAAAPFEFLFDAVRPAVVFAHSNKPIEFFAWAAGSDPLARKQPADWRGHRFTLIGRPGPLWRCSFEEAAAIGSELAELVN